VWNATAQRILLVLLALTLLVPRLVDLAAASRILTKQRGLSADMLVARDLDAMGIKRGDAVAIVGDGFQHYYAYLAGVHIIAQISNPTKFWSLTPSHVIVVEQTLAQTGAKALITSNRPPAFQPSSWRTVQGTGYSILPLVSKE
jgi:hypothetical protein